MFEHLVPDTLQHTLADCYHHTAVYKCRDNAAEEDRSQHGQRHVQF